MSDRDWRVSGPVTVVTRAGQSTVFETLDIATEYYHWVIDRLEFGFLQTPFYNGEYYTRGDEVEFRDDLGMRIPIWKVREARDNRPWGYAPHCTWHHARSLYDPEIHFRNGPVPGYGTKRRGRYGHYLRAPRTTQEIRENEFLDVYDEDAREVGVKARGRRKTIPIVWDDLPVCLIKNWKKTRRTQWRA